MDLFEYEARDLFAKHGPLDKEIDPASECWPPHTVCNPYWNVRGRAYDPILEEPA